MNLAFLSLGTPEILLVGLLLIIPLITLIDIIRSDFKDQSTKLLWAVIVLVAPFLGCLLYFVMGRQQKVNKYI